MRLKILCVSLALLTAGRAQPEAQRAAEKKATEEYSAQLFAAMKETPLRTAVRDLNRREARIWSVHALGGFETVFIRRDGDRWSVVTWVQDPRTRTLKRNEVAPRSPWDGVWEAMCAKGLLTLPDFSTFPRDGTMVADGSTLRVETLNEGKYREYVYANPAAHDHEEARAIEAIYAIVAREFFGRETKETVRKFLSDAEVRELADAIGKISYPLTRSEFTARLPLDLPQRGLQRHPDQWNLTTRVGHAGLFLLRTIETSATIRSAQVVFYTWEDENERILKPGEDPAKLRAEMSIHDPRPPVTAK